MSGRSFANYNPHGLHRVGLIFEGREMNLGGRRRADAVRLTGKALTSDACNSLQ